MNARGFWVPFFATCAVSGLAVVVVRSYTRAPAAAPSSNPAAAHPQVGPLVTPAPPRPSLPPLLGVYLSGDAVDLSPRVDGRVVEVLVQPGSRVQPGDVVARLDVRDVAKQLALARAALHDAQQRVSRREGLVSGDVGAISKEELANARVAVLEKRTRVEELTQSLTESDIRAPFAGQVSARYVDSGAVVGPGRPVVRLVGEVAPRVRFAVPEDRASDVRLHAPVMVEIKTYRLSLPGLVENVAPEVDVAARMIFAVASVKVPADWAGRIPSGTVVRVAVAPVVSGESATRRAGQRRLHVRQRPGPR
ncbi:MAG TPA: efflux RND transporter periplasmic adaptor subunit [Polyangia bacterium]|nr:efflux RND transporter periplasmic adaptor subunit [Polyangia bacterium]